MWIVLDKIDDSKLNYCLFNFFDEVLDHCGLNIKTK